MKIARGSAEATISINRRGIATVSVGGVLTPATVRAMPAECSRAAVEAGATALLHRLDRKITAYSLDDLPRPESMPAAMQALPGAIVVAAHDLAMYEAYCRRAGAAGIIRRVFTDEQRALAWLEAQQMMLRVTMAMRADPARQKGPCRRP